MRNIAQLLRVSSSRIWRVIDYYVGDAVDRMDCSTVTAVCVDETSARKRHDYISCFFDPDARRLVFATEGRAHQVVDAFARCLGALGGDSAAVREVSCDMSPAFITGIRESLPEAEVTFNRFHVARVFGDAVERVRRSEWSKDTIVKGSRFVLLKNPENLTDKQRGQLGEQWRCDKPNSVKYQLFTVILVLQSLSHLAAGAHGLSACTRATSARLPQL